MKDLQQQIDGKVKFWMVGNKFDGERMDRYRWDEMGQWQEPKETLSKTTKEIKRLIFLKNGGVMDLDEWAKIPADGTSKTEDAEFEVIDNRNCVFNVKVIEDRMKELGYLEDVPHKEIKKKK